MHVQISILDGRSCDRDDMLYKDTCYISTPYVARNQVTGIDWFGGQTYCGSLRSVIMYSHIEDKMFTSQLREWLKPSTKLQLWIGVRKKIWYWQKGGYNLFKPFYSNFIRYIN